MIASTYWFAAGADRRVRIQAIAVALADVEPPLVPTALAFAVVQAAVAAVARLRRDALAAPDRAAALDRRGRGAARRLARVGRSELRRRPRARLARAAADVARLRDRRDRHVRLVADARHEHRRPLPLHAVAPRHADRPRQLDAARDRDGDVHRAVFAVGNGETNPFVAASELTSSEIVLVVLLVAVVVQTFAANLTNVYTAGLLARCPACRRSVASGRRCSSSGSPPLRLSAFPSLIEEAQSWITHLGNLAAPITGVVLADYLVVRRGRLDVPSLYAPPGTARGPGTGGSHGAGGGRGGNDRLLPRARRSRQGGLGSGGQCAHAARRPRCGLEDARKLTPSGRKLYTTSSAP